MKISAVVNKPISFFKINSQNHQFFDEKGIDLSSMVEDIKKRGIQNPIVAKTDGTIIAGHCRFRSAIKAGLKTLPVKMAEEMTDEEELEYLLKDNTIRRHFGQADRLKIYRRIYPDFDKEVLINHTVSIAKIVSVSGLCYGTINSDITRIRKVSTDIRKRRTPEENALMILRRYVTQIRNKVISGDISPEDVKEIIDPLLSDISVKEATPIKEKERRLN